MLTIRPGGVLNKTWEVYDEDKEVIIEGGFFKLGAAIRCAEDICAKTGQSFRVRTSRG